MERILGSAAKTVSVAYVLNYLDENGQSKSALRNALVTIGNCGVVLNVGR
jgi:hypothetical protein